MSEKLLILGITLKRSLALHWQKTVSKVQTAFLFGNFTDRYFCPCCDRYSHHFVDWSSTYRNVVCPYCDSQPRHRALMSYLGKKNLLSQEKLTFLHFAPTRCFRQKLSSMRNLTYTTADLNDSSVDAKIDITQIPYPDDKFDVIFCNHVLEHVPNDRQGMRELLRTLKPGGWASLQVPLSDKIEKTFEDPTITSPQERVKHFWQEDHVRLYGLDYSQRLEEEGFIVKVEDVPAVFDAQEIRKYGLGPEKALYFGFKPT
jgi:SAM-dependent methyltransferase